MSKSVSKLQRYGKTTEWRGTAVYVDRQAVLTDELDQIVSTQASAVVLVLGDGYDDAQPINLAPKHALELYHALGDALMALSRTNDADTPQTPPPSAPGKGAE